MSAARETVISTPELLEATLYHLPMHDLLLSAPLVSKMWQATTLTPILQRALFFQPDPSSPRGLNPLLAKSFSPFFTSDEVWMWSVRDIGAMPWANAYKAFRRRQASWRRMLVMSFSVDWPHPDDAESEGKSEGELTLVVQYNEQDDTADIRRVFGKRFESVANNPIAVPFGEWKELALSGSASPQTRVVLSDTDSEDESDSADGYSFRSQSPQRRVVVRRR
ncbi:hypothetical protein DFH08DRAFT_959852 [Mycena albidolilacea]|uniref:F-box domain-containing protein n=1 Tax=Mycena albidolilacea TaxID=1033008 RepID=A0AAD7ESD7_9AGAR|nr:hypothetical protein DFH08DRAFT_959852 [Mycena albidolilacea]